MHGQLGLDLEAGRQRREGFDEAARHHPVAGQHVAQLLAEHGGDEAGERAVAELVAATVGGAILADARRHHHVGAGGELADQFGQAGGVVGGVAVDQHEDVGVDIAEHAAHDMALALAGLAHHDGAGRARSLAGAVGRIVVVDVDHGAGQRGVKIANHLRDGRGLVVAGDEYGNAARRGGARRFALPFRPLHQCDVPAGFSMR